VEPFGNAPRLNGATRWFGTFRENATLTKMLPFSEGMRGELRWEVYDIGNHKTWNRPVSADLANLTQFGVVTGASGNRTMQLGLKLVF
jgi:hypothetical protein